MADERDYYGTLGVPRDADDEVIRMAYRRLARLYHPDIAGTGSAERMREINVAYETLGDPERRRHYDTAGETGELDGFPAPTAHSSQPRAGTMRVTGERLRRVAALEQRDAAPVVAFAAPASGGVLASGALDGRITLWDAATRAPIRALVFGGKSPLGVLHDVRVAPDGTTAAAWGFHLGVRVWQARDGRTLWSAGLNGPAGSTDVQLLAGPERVRLALPDAPAALSEEDPFRWAYAGRLGTAILTRPLAGAIDPSAAIPLRCVEREGRRGGADGGNAFRIQQRMLSADGRLLLTVAAGRSGNLAGARVVALWDVEARSFTGTAHPRQVWTLVEPVEHLEFPLGASADLRWLAMRGAGGVTRVYATGGRRYTTVATGDLSQDALVSLAPDGVLLAVATGRVVRLWNVATGAEAQRWECAAEVGALRCLPWAGGYAWLLGFANGLIEVWA